jgi:hypothetical protein
MAYQFTTPRLGAQAIATSSDTQKHHLGEIQQAVDSTFGNGEFIYLMGVASTVVGSIVNYDAAAFQTALDTAAVTGPSRPLAIAMSANGAGDYGWYQIAGMAVATKANTVSFADGAGLGSASGLAVAVVTGTVLQGAVVALVASAKSDVTTVRVFINRPHGPSDVS